MKKPAITAVCTLSVTALIALALVFSDYTLSSLQRGTLRILLILCGCSVAYCFIVGEAVQNYSQMDKLWSLMPIAYTWVIAAKSGMMWRPVLFALIVTAWGIRLTVNFARKGAYSLRFWEGKEDYRWAIVHGSRFFKRRIAWTAFNLLFISFYQNLLVLAICLPSLAIMESAAPFGIWDGVAAGAAAAFLVLETVADEGQWHFHQTKARLLAENGALERLPMPYRLGFNTEGIWGWMRHPNYLGEQGVWCSLYLFTVGAGVTSHGLFHWSMIGALLLILLFLGSSTLGESISASKYPRYRDYAAQVSKYFPRRRFDADRHERKEEVFS